MRKIREYQQFKCPKCGGHCFGSSTDDDDKFTYHCQENNFGCNFSFPEEHLYKYYNKIVVYEYVNDKEFKADRFGKESGVATTKRTKV